MHLVGIVLGLLAAVAVLVGVARRIGIPYPVLLVLGGIGIALVPRVPPIHMEPELVFMLVLPPLLYAESWDVSWRDFRANLRPILLLAVGLVLATAAVVATVACWLIPGLSWPVAFVLGSVVAPTDEVAVMPVIERLAVPRRIATIVGGESLVCDGTALVLYRLATAAVISGSVSFWGAGTRFVVVCAGGVAIGLVAGWIAVQLFRVLNDPPVEITLSLLAPFGAYLPAEAIGVSSVIAVMTMGVYVGRHSSRIFSPQTRIQSRAFWEMLTFIINGVLFLLVGLEVRGILATASGGRAGALLMMGLWVSAAVVLTRIAWVFPATYLPRLLSRRLREEEPVHSWHNPAIVAWTGIRGALSLAAALAIPYRLQSGQPFPHRNELIAITFAVILSTLVLQGLTMPALIRWLNVCEDDAIEDEEDRARLVAAEAGLARLAEAARDPELPEEAVERLRERYQARVEHYREAENEEEEDERDRELQALLRLQRNVLEAERAAVLRLRDNGEINDEAMREVEEDLDLERVRLEGYHD